MGIENAAFPIKWRKDYLYYTTLFIFNKINIYVKRQFYHKNIEIIIYVFEIISLYAFLRFNMWLVKIFDDIK